MSTSQSPSGDDGRPVGKPLTVKNDALLIITLLKWVRSITDGTATWAIEDGRGFARRLADGLLLAGQEVVWVPARLAAAHRRLHEATGAKSDPIDAAAVARAAIATPGLDRHRIDERVRELRVLVDYRADLVKRRTMAINQLKAQVHLWLDQTPGDLTRARNVNALATLISAAQLSPHVRQALADMTAEIAALSRHVGDLDTTIRKLVSPLATCAAAGDRDQLQLRGRPARGDRRYHPLPQLSQARPLRRLRTRSRSTPPTSRATASTAAATGASTASFTPQPSCRSAAPPRPSNCWPATSQAKAPAAPAGSCNGT